MSRLSIHINIDGVVLFKDAEGIDLCLCQVVSCRVLADRLDLFDVGRSLLDEDNRTAVAGVFVDFSIAIVVVIVNDFFVNAAIAVVVYCVSLSVLGHSSG